MEVPNEDGTEVPNEDGTEVPNEDGTKGCASFKNTQDSNLVLRWHSFIIV